MKKRSFLTRTDLGSSTVLKRTESDLCWKRNKKPAEVHPFKVDQEPQDNCLNVYQQLTRSYSWLKQNVFHSPDAESIVISNKKIKHVLKEFNNKNFIIQNLTMEGSNAVTAYTKWETICEHLNASPKPVVLNRASSINTKNFFGPTLCYGYRDFIFEVMPNQHIASVTIYRSESVF